MVDGLGLPGAAGLDQVAVNRNTGLNLLYAESGLPLTPKHLGNQDEPSNRAK